MPILPLALPASSNQGEQPHSGVAALINAYAIPTGSGRKSEMIIRASSGLSSMASLDAGGGIRGLQEVDGTIFAVVGRVLLAVDSGGHSTVLGGIPSDGFVGIARNQRGTGVQTCIVSGGLAWIVENGVLMPISDVDLPPPIDVCCINQSFIFAASDGRMVRSEINDGFDIDGLDVAVAESAPDELLRVVDRGSDLIAIGARSTEVWTDQGGEAFGFSRANVISVGAVGPRAVTKATVLGEVVTDTVAWCATDAAGRFAGVIMLNGYTPQKISTAYIDRIVDQVADKSGIIASSWVERGRAMIAWRLPDTTIVYDTSTSLWHERRSRSSTGGEATWRVGLTTVVNGRVVAGDADRPELYWLEPDVEDEAGDEMIMIIRTPPLHAFPGRVECNHVHLDIVPGVGLVHGDANPVVVMRKSLDGETWGGERERAMGQQGQRLKRVSWSSLGTFDSATLEFRCSAAVTREILSASWDGKVLSP